MLKYTVITIGLFALYSCGTKTEQVDVLIRNGNILDGTGNEVYLADIAIKADTIYFIGQTKERNFEAEVDIDASGKIISPGFIDPHTHALSDLSSSDKNGNENYLTQGVTTVFVGNDGEGPYQISKKSQQLTDNGIGTNVAFLIGHGKVRKTVLGDHDVEPTPAQMEEMKLLIRAGMKEGAFGFSTGLYYAPGSFAETDEVIELTKEIAAFDGIYDSHIRDESTYNIGLLEAVRETIEIGRKAKVAIHFAHIKALGVDVWRKSDEVIALIEKAQKEGIVVTADQYPWRASGTHLENAVINRWVMAGGEEKYYSRLEDLNLLPKIKSEIKENIRRRGGAEALLITADCKDESMIGLNLSQIAEKLQTDEIEAVLHIAKNGGARVASFNMNLYDIENFMKKPWVMTSSDGTKGHPRKYATFPKKYEEYVLNRKTLSIESFVHKSSGLVARTFGIKKRGVLKQGFYADVIVWDKAKFSAIADFSNPEELSEGIEYAFVNGNIAIAKGAYTEALRGRVLAKE